MMFERFDIETQCRFNCIYWIAAEFAQYCRLSGIVETKNKNSKFLLFLFNLNM